MSQELDPISDTAGNAPANSYLVLAAGGAISCSCAWDGIAIGNNGAWGGDLDIPSTVPLTGDITFSVACGMSIAGYDGATVDYSIITTHPLYGIIAEFTTTFTATAGSSHTFNLSMTNAQFVLNGYDLGLFFGSSLNVLIGIGLGMTPGIPWSGTFGISSFSMLAADGTGGADIEFLGNGGVLVSGEADTESSGMPLVIIGSGGVLVGSIGSVTTPLVVSKDPSGLYTIIVGQHHDTVYTRNVDPDDTDDVAIPTPFAKTGYFGA